MLTSGFYETTDDVRAVQAIRGSQTQLLVRKAPNRAVQWQS